MRGPLNVAFFQSPKGCSRRLCGVASKIKPSHGGWGYTLRVKSSPKGCSRRLCGFAPVLRTGRFHLPSHHDSSKNSSKSNPIEPVYGQLTMSITSWRRTGLRAM